MQLTEHITEALHNLAYAKLRSSLALLGVLVGTASVVAMVSSGQLATYETLQQFKSLGTNLLAVSINVAPNEDGIISDHNQSLSLEQSLALQQSDKNIERVAPYTQLFSPLFYEGHQLNGVVLGITENFTDILHISFMQGRSIRLLDGYQFYCVIGQDIYHAIKAISYREPLGQQLQVGKNIFTIIGIANTWPENSFVYANIDTAIMIPLSASTLISKYAAINNLILRLQPAANINKVEKNITATLDVMVPNKQLTLRSAKELIAKMRKQSDILTVFLGLIGSVSLLVGGIGVMNIMLVSVAERRREIGIRLAVGARRADIGILFLVEAVVLSLLGGVLGVVIGMTITFMIAMLWHWQYILFFWPPFIGFSVAVAIGIFFGVYPAYQASRLNPIDALRSE